MTTQKEVAQLAGVSFITVSRVVNNEGNVREETSQRVLAAIRELGYVPSYAGKALNSGRNDTIGVMTPARFGENLENEYLTLVLRGIETACREHGQDILISPISEDETGFDYLRPYRQRKVDGMIYVGLKEISGEMIRDIEERHIPCVVLADRPAHRGISWVDTDNESAARETTRRIWAVGHRRIAFLGLLPGLYNANISDRERGFRRAIRELSGTEPDESAILRGDYGCETNRAIVGKALSDPRTRPTALFCATDNKAIAAFMAAKDLGLSVPDEISIVGFDGFLKNRFIHPSIATNEQPLIEMGRRAAQIILERVGKDNVPKREEVFPVSFVPGESLASVRV